MRRAAEVSDEKVFDEPNHLGRVVFSPSNHCGGNAAAC
jgi:hypothetical protein